jgi:amino acid transporter
MIATPRATYAMAAQKTLPAWFGKVSPRFATPSNSILFMALAALLLAVSGSFVWLAVVSTLARLFAYAASIAALPKAKGGIVNWILAGAGLLVCVWAAAQSKWESWAMLAGFVLAGFLLYGLGRIQRGRADQASASSAETVSSIQPPPSTRSPS